MDCVYFNHGTPCHTIPDVMTFLEEACDKYGVVEIGCHPGYSDAYLRSLSILNDDRGKGIGRYDEPGAETIYFWS